MYQLMSVIQKRDKYGRIVSDNRVLQNGRQSLYNALFKARLLIFAASLFVSFFSTMFRLNVLAALLWVPYFIIVLKTNGRFCFRYLVFFLSSLFVLGSVYVIESNVLWLYELGVYSECAGAFPPICSYYMAFLLSLEFFDAKFCRDSRPDSPCVYTYHHKNSTPIMIKSIVFFCFLLLAVSFARVIRHPNFINPIDRFVYLDLYVNGAWEKIRGWLIYFIPVLLIGMNTLKNKASIIIVLAVYLLYLLWTGERYTGFLQIIFLMSSFLTLFQARKNSRNLKRKKDSAVKWIAVILIWLTVVFLNAIHQYGRGVSAEHGLNSFFIRVAEQGQLWWRTFSLFSGEMPHLSELNDELRAFTDPDSNYYGIYKIMYLCAPSSIVSAKISAGQNYTESSAASVYYYFGKVGLILFAVSMGCVFAKLICKYESSIIEARVLQSICYARLLMVMLNVFSMSRFYLLFRPSTLLILFGIAILNAMRPTRSVHVETIAPETS